jgi:type 1 glutamine amidotransferase
MQRRASVVGPTWLLLAAATLIWSGQPQAQTPPAPAPARPQAPGTPAARPPGPPPSTKKHILVIGQALGFEHDSISIALGTIWKMGRDSGAYEAEIKTDTSWVTKKPTKANSQNLDRFDAIVFVSSTGELPLDDEQKASLLAFVHDEGKGLVGVHAALDSNYKWPEYGEMIGGWFEAHPFNTFDAPVIIEDPAFPAMRHFPPRLTLRDEMYQAKAWSRDKVNVLMRMDETKLDYTGKTNTRPDKDFALAWSKTYGKGRVFYSTLGHTKESWDDPQVQTMYLEAIKWVLGRTEGSTTPHAKQP